MKKTMVKSGLLLFAAGILFSCTPNQGQDKTSEALSDGSVLPFPEPPSASVTGKTLEDSKNQWRKAESRLPAGAPNIVIFMTDDAVYANASTFGGPVNTPTLDRLVSTGISYTDQ